MKKTGKFLALVMALAMALSLAACGGPSIEVPSTPAPSQNTTGGGSSTGGDSSGGSSTPEATPAPELTFAQGTELRMATGYNNSKNAISFDPDVAGEGIKLADGNTYHSGDLKPTWVELENILGIKFTDKFTGAGSDTKEFDYWKEQLDQVDMLSGTAKQFTENGVAGTIVNIAEYLDMMPNFKAYLDANPIVYMSIVGDTATGAIYFSPYFDGVDDIERMPLMRTDWVQKLLDGEGAFSNPGCDTTKAPVYQPYMPASGKIAIDTVKLDGSGVETVTKDYDAAGNIVAAMNAKGAMSGEDAVNMLRDYIDKAYGGYYGTARSNLFVGQNACWDADELVALLRCVTSNSNLLNADGKKVQGIFSREDDNNQRRVDMFKLAGHLFGVRGLESRYSWMYVDTDGKFHDARMNEETYKAMERMHDMAMEGLISEAFMTSAAEKTQTYLENDLGFMHYDYNQTQTIYNNSALQEGEKYMAAMVPVACWQDGTPGGNYMRFTESWRSVKDGGWGISKAGVGDDQDKLYACLKLIDYAYSPEGQILMSYGPSAWQSDKTFMFNGKEMPQISDAAREELWSLAKGNYTNYARQYLGSTLSFMKSQAFEYQCTTDVGREGAGYISTAIGLGTIKHPILGVVSDNMWYTSCPTVLPLSQTDNDMINGYTSLGKTLWGVSKGDTNLLVDLITDGWGEKTPGMSDAASAAATVSGDFSGSAQLVLLNDAWANALAFYDTIK